MKASEVLRRYRNGERDFRRVSLRGESFKSENLTGADFTEADIRGANFTNAYLIGTKFRGAKAGLQRRWKIGLVIASWILSGLSGIFAGSTAYLVSVIFDSNIANLTTGVITIILVLFFFIITSRQGLAAGFGSIAIAVAFTVAGSLIFTMAGALAIAVTFAAVVVVVGGLAISVIFAAIVARFIAVVVALAITVTFAATITIFIAKGIEQAVPLPETLTVAIGGTCTITVVLFSAYIAWCAWVGDEQHAWIQRIAVMCAATGGTSFRGADLTDADFTGARLKSTDFRRAILTCTRWYNANKLDRVRPGKSYLSRVAIRELVRTLQGQDKNFDGSFLRGVNLQGANLADASFIGADLNEANLQDTDLSRAKLIQTQLDEADLTGATLTGATIEDWSITRSTKLYGVRCQYVFMRLPTKDDPNPRRKPDSWDEMFEDGDFADFIKPIVDTLDLYHNQGVDPRAIAISFKQLAENNPDAQLEIVAMEKRGKDKFLLRAATVPEADHSQLNAEYFTTYGEIKALAAVEVQALLTEKDSRISSLENMVETALQRPGFYAQNYNHQGDTMPDQSSKINISDVTGSKISGVAGGESTAVAGKNLTGVAGGDISGTVTNTINQLTESELPEAPTLADLLKQLQIAIASQDSGLSEKDKQKALKHLDTIGKLGVDRNNSHLQEMAENALDALPTILKRGAGLMKFVKTHFDIELDEMLENIQSILNFT